MKLKMLLILTAGFLMCCRAQDESPTPVGSVDLKRYAGKWYDVASFPVRFQKGCHCTTAEYTLMPEGHIKVENRCRKGGYNEKISGISGRAYPVEASNNTKLKVQFFWPFRSDYWIVRLDKEYAWAVVSNASKEYLWILSRTPAMEEKTFQTIIDDLKNDGYNTANLVKVPQLCS